MMTLFSEKSVRRWLRSLGMLCAILLIFARSAPSRTLRVVVVESAARPEYERTTKALVSTLRSSSLSITSEEAMLEGRPEAQDAFWEGIVNEGTDLIITVGTPATRSAINTVRAVPIVFTMVLDQFGPLGSRAAPSSHADISGVTLAIPVREQLEMMLNTLLAVRRVGFIYSKESAQMYVSARDIAEEMGLRLVDYEISSERDIPGALEKIIPEVDVLWMPPDAIIYEGSILRFILLECFRKSVPIMAVSRQIAEAGTPLALGFDYDDIGKQTAELALQRLSSTASSRPLRQTPRTVILYVNKRVSSSMGLEIPSRILEKAVPVESGR